MSLTRIAAANEGTEPRPYMAPCGGCAVSAAATCLQVRSELELPLDAAGAAIRCTVSMSSCKVGRVIWSDSGTIGVGMCDVPRASC